MQPSKYFTKNRIQARRRGEHPELLFHFTPRSRALKILEDGFLRGHPVLSLTENPAFVSPGPAVLVVDSACVLQNGYELWPHLWQRGAEQEAEWIAVPRGTEEHYDVPHPVALPLDCVRYVGLVGSFGVERERIFELAEERGIEAGQFDWEEWWHHGTKPKLSGPERDPLGPLGHPGADHIRSRLRKRVELERGVTMRSGELDRIIQCLDRSASITRIEELRDEALHEIFLPVWALELEPLLVELHGAWRYEGRPEILTRDFEQAGRHYMVSHTMDALLQGCGFPVIRTREERLDDAAWYGVPREERS